MTYFKTYWTQRNTLLLTSLVSFLSLSWAYIAQYHFNINPCVLCYYERYVYWSIIIIGFLSLLPFGRSCERKTCFLFLALGIVLLGGLGLGIYHLGVEWHWWQGTAACRGITQKAQSIEELRKLIASKPMARCDQINWRIFSVSATLWNFLWFLGFSMLWMATAVFTEKRR